MTIGTLTQWKAVSTAERFNIAQVRYLTAMSSGMKVLAWEGQYLVVSTWESKLVVVLDLAEMHVQVDCC